MSEQRRQTTQAWFERQFPFPVSAHILPDVLARLASAPDRAAAALRGQPRERLLAKSDGKWSAQEHAGHLLDLEPLWLARVEDYLTMKDQLTPADLTNQKTHLANHNQQPLESILTRFQTARRELLQRANLPEPLFTARAILHPRLGVSLRLIDHLYFVAEHDDHHLAAIASLLALPR